MERLSYDGLMPGEAELTDECEPFRLNKIEYKVLRKSIKRKLLIAATSVDRVKTEEAFAALNFLTRPPEQVQAVGFVLSDELASFAVESLEETAAILAEEAETTVAYGLASSLREYLGA